MHPEDERREGDQSSSSRIIDQFRTLELIQDRLRYIVVEGVTGAGKSFLARALSERLAARLVLEEFEENPFLPLFFEDRKRWAFQTQLSFLSSRFRQQQQFVERDLFHRIVISDYTFEKDRIFASVNLDGDELRLYETLFTMMVQNTPVPDMIIYLQAGVEHLLEAVRRKAHPFEERIERAYVEQLAEAYDYFFFRYVRAPVLVVNTEVVDFVNDAAVVGELLRQVATIRYGGTTYFRPTRSGIEDR